MSPSLLIFVILFKRLETTSGITASISDRLSVNLCSVPSCQTQNQHAKLIGYENNREHNPRNSVLWCSYVISKMETRFISHLCIFVAIFSSSITIAVLLYIDLYVTIGYINLSNESFYRNLLLRPSLRKTRLNTSVAKTWEMCHERYGSQLRIKFNIGDTVAVLVLIGTIVIGLISLYTFWIRSRHSPRQYLFRLR